MSDESYDESDVAEKGEGTAPRQRVRENGLGSLEPGVSGHVGGAL